MDSPRLPIRRNTVKTKARIVRAAQAAFSEIGYPRAGIRHIAEDAGVAPSLLLQHFGSKANLFEAALLASMTEQELVEGDRATFGERLANKLATNADVALPTMIVLSIGDADACAVSDKILRDYVVGRTAEWLGPPNARSRAMSINMICTGFIVYARKIPTEPVSQHTIDWLARSVQAIVDEC
jgi:AcrR family transcriptional regulator